MKFAIQESTLLGNDTPDKLTTWFRRFGEINDATIVELSDDDKRAAETNGWGFPFNVGSRIVIFETPDDDLLLRATFGECASLICFFPDLWDEWDDSRCGRDIPVYKPLLPFGDLFKYGKSISTRTNYLPEDARLLEYLGRSISCRGEGSITFQYSTGGVFTIQQQRPHIFARPIEFGAPVGNRGTHLVVKDNELLDVCDEFHLLYGYRPKALPPIIHDNVHNFVVGETVVGQCGMIEGRPAVWTLVPICPEDGRDGGLLSAFLKFIASHLINVPDGVNTDGLSELISTLKVRSFEEVKSRINTREREVRSLARRLTTEVRELESDRLVARRAEETLSEETERIIEQVCKQLGNFKSIKGIQVRGPEVIVMTNKIFCRNPHTGVLHELGRFLIQINLMTTEPYNGLKFFNLDRKVNNHHAPHVDGGGIPCLGNMIDILPQAFGTGDLTTIVTMALAFLEDVKPNDEWGRYIVEWPEADEGEYERLYGSPNVRSLDANELDNVRARRRRRVMEEYDGPDIVYPGEDEDAEGIEDDIDINDDYVEDYEGTGT